MYTYEFCDQIANQLNKDRAEAHELEGSFYQIVKEGSYKGKTYDFDLYDLINQIHQIYGELCWEAYREAPEHLKSFEAYSTTWGELLEDLMVKAQTSLEYKALGDYMHSKYQPFHDGDTAREFGEMAYNMGLMKASNMEDILLFGGETFEGEYYWNQDLKAKAGQKALKLAESLEDYMNICADENWSMPFDEATFKEAIEIIIERKEEIEQDDLDNFIEALEEIEQEEYIQRLK